MSEKPFFYDTAHEIVPNLWVGNLFSCSLAREQGFKTVCVLENPCAEGCHHRRILSLDTKIVMDNVGLITAEQWRTEIRVEPEKLEEALRTVDEFLQEGPVLVHCAAGIERSPLLVVVWLTRNWNMSLDEAYKFVMAKRPIVQDRGAWLQSYRAEDLIGG